MDKIEAKELIQSCLELIALCELDKEAVNLSDAGYINQRTLISSLFKGEYNQGQIILRLTVIDSLYSTNAAYSYFSFEEMAEKISKLGSQADARAYFYKIACGGKDDKCLFCEPYGYQKNLAEGSKQMSLLSKYAYYELMQDPKKYPLGFPIYDRLAKEAYPLVRKMLGEKDYYSMPQADGPSIEQYVMCLEQLRSALFSGKDLFHGYQQFDILDAYLWRMGKFTGGNLSLLLGREDYERFILNIGLAAPQVKGTELRKETPEYEAYVKGEFARLFPGVKSFDFNLLIQQHLLHDNAAFKELNEETYLNALLEHWKLFYSYADKAPQRGVSLPK